MTSPSRPLRLDDVQNVVQTRCPSGHPQVLRCYPLRTGGDRFEPFPTLFWLVCPALTHALSRLEHEGWIQRLQDRMLADETFRTAVSRDHQTHIEERWSLLSERHRLEIERRGLEGAFRDRGIGGIRDPSAVKCLHLHYAHHLARGSAIGRALDEVGLPPPCTGPQE